MNGNREALKNLQQQTLEKRRLDARLRELYAQRETLKKQTEELEQARQKEQADVDRLEGRSLAAFFYYTVGRLDEKLDKERQEAYAAPGQIRCGGAGTGGSRRGCCPLRGAVNSAGRLRTGI